MKARLSDLYAPPWRHALNGVYRDMKPLSLATFAELEGYDITIGRLQSGDAVVWLQLYAFLARMPLGEPDAADETLVAAVHVDPLGFQQFQEFVKNAFAGTEDGEGPTVVRRRRIKDPREQEKEREGKVQETDMSFLIYLARMSSIPLSELLRMTFRGIHAVQASLEDMPPVNPMASLMGGASAGQPGPRR